MATSSGKKSTALSKKKSSASASNKKRASKKVTTYLKHPKLGNFFFDAVFSAQHRLAVTVTKHPVQDGASISDHAYKEPDEITLDIGMTDAMSDATKGHSVNAYKTLCAMMELRQPVKLVTRLKTYTDMVITSISAPDDVKTMNGLRATIIFSQIETVKVKTVKVKETIKSSKGGGSKKNTAKNPTGGQANKAAEKVENKSVLKQISEKVKGP